MPGENKPATLELRNAQLIRTLELLERLDRSYPKGFSTTEQQDLRREVQAHLVTMGIRRGEELHAPKSPSWADDPPPWTRKR